MAPQSQAALMLLKNKLKYLFKTLWLLLTCSFLFLEVGSSENIDCKPPIVQRNHLKAFCILNNISVYSFLQNQKPIFLSFRDSLIAMFFTKKLKWKWTPETQCTYRLQQWSVPGHDQVALSSAPEVNGLQPPTQTSDLLTSSLIEKAYVTDLTITSSIT